MCFMSLVKNYGGLIACRVLLGLFEGSFFTSVLLSWSYWYHPTEMAPRILWLYVANSSSGGFSGLFAYAVSFANSSTIYGWQVLFILEGLVTVTLGIGMWFLLPDWPSTSKWLTPLEQEFVVHHLHRDAPKLTSQSIFSTFSSQPDAEASACSFGRQELQLARDQADAGGSDVLFFHSFLGS